MRAREQSGDGERARALNVVGTQVTMLAANATTQSYGITLQQGEASPTGSPDIPGLLQVLEQNGVTVAGPA